MASIGLSEYGAGECAVCLVRCRVGNLMCPEHWRQVPTFERNWVLGALRLWEHGEVGLDVLRQAQDAAIASVECRRG